MGFPLFREALDFCRCIHCETEKPLDSENILSSLPTQSRSFVLYLSDLCHTQSSSTGSSWANGIESSESQSYATTRPMDDVIYHFFPLSWRGFFLRFVRGKWRGKSSTEGSWCSGIVQQILESWKLLVAMNKSDLRLEYLHGAFSSSDRA